MHKSRHETARHCSLELLLCKEKRLILLCVLLNPHRYSTFPGPCTTERSFFRSFLQILTHIGTRHSHTQHSDLSTLVSHILRAYTHIAPQYVLINYQKVHNKNICLLMCIRDIQPKPSKIVRQKLTVDKYIPCLPAKTSTSPSRQNSVLQHAILMLNMHAALFEFQENLVLQMKTTHNMLMVHIKKKPLLLCGQY